MNMKNVLRLENLYGFYLGVSGEYHFEDYDGNYYTLENNTVYVNGKEYCKVNEELRSYIVEKSLEDLPF